MILNRLTTLRKAKRWSLQYTADRLGIAKSTYAGYESGHRRPSLETINLLAGLYDTSTDYILGRVDYLTSSHGINGFTRYGASCRWNFSF